MANILAKLSVLIGGDASGLNKTVTQTTKQLGNFEKASVSAGKAFAGAFAAISFVQIGREIINITAEFQKFEAVLTNTLGSQSEAQEALERIRDFAAKTPFSVQELTSSFVKLANQGFKPSGDEMQRLGDLASSTGKSFDQLTEAIIDAQVGEFERLKEFGIRAQKQGDQVKFTFKGVETQTKFTADSIRDYILSLGQLEGVSGSMDAISKTLGGSISNLGDSFDNLLLTIGSLTSGPLKGFIDQAKLAIETLAGDIKGDVGETTILSKIKEEFVDGAESADQITASIQKLTGFLKQTTDESANLATKTATTSEEMQQLEKDFASAKDFSNAYGIAIGLLTKKLEGLKTATETVPTLSIIQNLNAEIKHFEELKSKSFSIDQIGRFNVKLHELRDELEFINATGSESGFLKNLNAGTAAPVTEQALPTPTNPFQSMIDVDVQPVLDKFNEISQASDAFNISEETRINAARARHQTQIALLAEEEAARARAANTALQYGDAIGSALGNAISGEESFADALKNITKQVLNMFLKQALGAIAASAVKSGGPPPVALALAAVGMAAVSAIFSRLGATGGSGGGSPGVSSSNVQRLPQVSGGNQIDFNARFEIEGTKLVAVTNNTNNRSQRTG